MKTLVKIAALSSIMIWMINGSLASQDNRGITEKYWKPQSDDVYLQESAIQIKTEQPVKGVGLSGSV